MGANGQRRKRAGEVDFRIRGDLANAGAVRRARSGSVLASVFGDIRLPFRIRVPDGCSVGLDASVPPVRLGVEVVVLDVYEDGQSVGLVTVRVGIAVVRRDPRAEPRERRERDDDGRDDRAAAPMWMRKALSSL